MNNEYNTCCFPTLASLEELRIRLVKLSTTLRTDFMGEEELSPTATESVDEELISRLAAAD